MTPPNSNLEATTPLETRNLETLFAAFIRERQFLANLSPRTIRYHRACFDSLRAHCPGAVGSTPPDGLTRLMLVDYAASLAQSGVKAISIDSYVRGLNCFFAWLHREGHAATRLRIPRPCFELEVPRTLDDAEIAALVHLKPRTRTMRRVHAIALVCLDTGCRVKEVTGLRLGDLDLDMMTLRVMGKGRRERIVPFSPELRRVLFRWINSEPYCGGNASRASLIFSSGDGVRLRYDNLRRDYRMLMRNAGIENPGGFHRLRHTYATLFIRSGRGEILLSRILGHRTLEMTRRYVQNNVDDLRGSTPISLREIR